MELINKLYQNEHKHKVGVDGWTVEQNLVHRKKYAPDILGEIKDVLDEIEERGDLLPKSELREAITYLRNEWNAVVDIFNLFEYLTDVINRTAEWQPNTPLEKYRELLPDKWEKENS